MINGLMEWCRNIVCFSIFAALVKNLLPGEKYKPYVKLYMGFMMMFVFFTPILKVLDADVTLRYLTEILGGTLEIKEDSFLDSINGNSNYERQKKEYTKMLEESVVNYLTERMDGQADWQEYTVERAEVCWEETEESEEFGMITGMSVYLKRKGELEEEENAIVIEPIIVEVFSGMEEQVQEEEPKESKQVKQLLAKFYRLQEENIMVKITE